jgi:hypothetical protein
MKELIYLVGTWGNNHFIPNMIGMNIFSWFDKVDMLMIEHKSTTKHYPYILHFLPFKEISMAMGVPCGGLQYFLKLQMQLIN